MAKSFLLKDETGRHLGYVEQIEDTVRGSIRTDDVRCEVYLVFDDGTVSVNGAEPGCGERVWNIQKGKKLQGASVLANGRVCAETEKGVGGRALRAQLSKRREVEKRPVKEEKVLDRERPCRQRVFLERQWPPNPCCPELWNSPNGLLTDDMP